MFAVSKPLLGTPLHLAHPLNQGLVGYWPMGEKGGQRVGDVAGMNQAGVLTGVTPGATSGWTGTPRGGGLRFDGTDDYVLLPSAPVWKANTKGTIAAWMYFINTPASDGVWTIWESNQSADALSFINLSVWNRALAPTGLHLGGFSYVSSTQKWVIYGATVLTLRTWYHVALVQNAVTPKLYINGYDDASTVDGGGSDNTTWMASLATSDFHGLGMGKRSGALATANAWPGVLEDVRIWNRALTGRDVQQLAAQPFCMFAGGSAYRRMPGRSRARLGA